MLFHGVTCDYDECTNELTVDPSFPAASMHDAGWSVRNGEHFCPEHTKEYVSVAFVVELTPELRTQLTIIEGGGGFPDFVELNGWALTMLAEASLNGKGTFSLAEIGVSDWALNAGADPEEWV